MAPIRRYLRISPHSVLETRIYLEDPYSLSWLLSPQSDVLDRVVVAIKPFVLRQLREEREHAQGRSKKKKRVKDTAVRDDFEVSVFLTDGLTQHNLMIKQKGFGPRRSKIQSNAGKLTGWLDGSREKPMELELDDAPPPMLREESDDDEQGPGLGDFPEADAPRARQRDDDDISDDEGFATTQANIRAQGDNEADGDDKKKMAMNLSYDGFAIYGKVLCLVVKRRKGRPGVAASGGGGRQMLESWVSTQAEQEPPLLDD